ncbi:MAG: type II secretion system minor pseudopilin GspK [Pseudomonadales bacterium]
MVRHFCRQSGVALLSTMVMVTVISLILGSLYYRHQLEILRSARQLSTDSAFLLTLSAEYWAKQLLADSDSNVVHLQQDWAISLPLLPVEGGELTGKIRDLQGSVNLNNLADYTAERWASEMEDGQSETGYHSVLQRLLETDDDELSAALIDWLDENTEELQYGAEDGYYQTLSPARMPANTPLASIAELPMVAGWSLEHVRRLQGLAVALPDSTAININTAPIEVLAALLSDLSETALEELIEQRPFDSVSEFVIAAEDAGQDLALPPAAMLTVASEFFELETYVQLGMTKLTMTSTLFRGANGEVMVIARTLRHGAPPVQNTADNGEDGDEDAV